MGQTLIAAAPVSKTAGHRLTVGASYMPNDGHGLGPEAELRGPQSSLLMALAFYQSVIEIGPVGRWGAWSESGLAEVGGRFRVAPHWGRLGVTVTGELGGRRSMIEFGESTVCVDGSCTASDDRLGESGATWTGYIALSVAPVWKIADGLYLYAGVGVDQLLESYGELERYDDEPSKDRPEVKGQGQFTAVGIGGLDWRIDEGFGVLFGMRTQPLVAPKGTPGRLVELAVSYAH